jgi:hypothetical protein
MSLNADCDETLAFVAHCPAKDNKRNSDKGQRMRKLVMILAIAAITAACSDFAQAELDIPANGTFGIVIDPPGTPGISFDPIPWVSPSLLESVYLWPFAKEGLYTIPDSEYHLAQAQFADGSINITDPCIVEGDLGIRINNNSGATRTFGPSVLTLDFVGDSFDIYLPGFTFDWMTDMFFWVAQSGATYYANSSKDVGLPDMLAGQAMSDPQYLARTPEPATVALLGLGAVLLRRRKFLSNRH